MTSPAAHNFHSFAASGRAIDPLTRTLNQAASTTHATGKTEHEKLVKQTETWVAQTFFGTLLKQMRNSPFKSELFEGGKGGAMFAALQDQQLAEHMTRGAGSKLVNGIVRRIEANAAYKRQGVKRQNPPANASNPSSDGGATAGSPSRAPAPTNTAGQASRGTI
jgi:Rod binding domain-containing protein